MSEAHRSHQWRISVESQRLAERPRPPPAPITIGEPHSDADMPDEVILVDDGDTAFMRLHIHHPKDEYHLKTGAQPWADWIVVGFSCRIVLVSIHDGSQRSISLLDEQAPSSFDYFCHIACDLDYLLVCSGRRVFRIGTDGDVLWKGAEVGLDGVITHDVTAGVIHGTGEWDPPGGWQPFRLSLATGAAIPE
jgi:hypothetical protein